jgi:alpha-tubulin suppressor-like RCC1 family protein
MYIYIYIYVHINIWLYIYTGITVTALSVGAGHSVIASNHGVVYGWGISKQGQLGLNTTENTQFPTIVTALQGKVTALSCGLAHTVFLSAVYIYIHMYVCRYTYTYIYTFSLFSAYT